MKDPRLVSLNFRELIDYGGQPAVRNSYAEQRRPGYCVSCEDNGVLAKTGGHLDLMSHACDSEDFKKILGPMPRKGMAIDAPVLFLLEEPGGDKENGCEVCFRGFRKQPPIYHYYWTPNIDIWPTRVAEFGNNFYGPYFAYLMRRHQLLNVYITNLVKCRWLAGRSSGNKSLIVNHCTSHFLAREVEIFSPQVALCFGGAARRGAETLLARLAPRCRVQDLLHPSYIKNRHQVHTRTEDDCVRINDERVRQVLRVI
jgi:hypothetical protein